MPTPLTGDRKFRDQLIRVSDITVNTSLLDGHEFSNCRIVGPAVFALLDNVTITGCRWDTSDLNALFWLVHEDRPMVVGAVGVRNCVFSGCGFEQVGLAGPAELFQILKSGFNSP